MSTYDAGLMSTRIARLMAATLFAGLVLAPSVASAGASCDPDPTLNVSPPQGYPGVTVHLSGTNYTPGTITINFSIHNNVLQTQATADSSGSFSSSFTVPAGTAPGTAEILVFDGPANCQVQRNYIIGSPPTTTVATTTSTTSAPTTTTTVPPTTTQATTTTTGATTSTVAPTTTQPSSTTLAATTTSLTDDTTTTTVVDEGSGGGGVSATVIVLIVLGVLLLVALIFAVRWMRRS